MQIVLEFTGEVKTNIPNYSIYTYLSRAIPDYHNSSEYTIKICASFKKGGVIYGNDKKPISIFIRCSDKVKLFNAYECIKNYSDSLFGFKLIKCSIQPLQINQRNFVSQIVIKNNKKINLKRFSDMVSKYDLELTGFFVKNFKFVKLKDGVPPIGINTIQFEVSGKDTDILKMVEGGLGKMNKFGFGTVYIKPLLIPKPSSNEVLRAANEALDSEFTTNTPFSWL